MPILHRNVVPNVPAWTADNGKIVFRNGAPSHQAEMEFRATWSGDVVTPYGTIAGAEINAALAAIGWGDYPFCYGVGEANVMDTPNTFAYSPGGPSIPPDAIGITDFGPLRIDVTLVIGIVWAAVNNDWRWIIELRRLAFWKPEPDYVTVCNSLTVGRFESTPTTQKLRLGNGTVLNFAGVVYPDTDPDLVWRNTACSGCSITLAAQYAQH